MFEALNVTPSAEKETAALFVKHGFLYRQKKLEKAMDDEGLPDEEVQYDFVFSSTDLNMSQNYFKMYSLTIFLSFSCRK